MPTSVSSVGGALAGLPRRHRLVRQDGVDDLIADRHHRVERVHRALEDHRDIAPAELLQLIVVIANTSAPRKRTSPPVMTAGGLQHAHHRVGDRRLAAARLTGQAEDFAGWIANETPSTARTGPRAVRYSTCRSRTSSSGPVRASGVSSAPARGCRWRSTGWPGRRDAGRSALS